MFLQLALLLLLLLLLSSENFGSLPPYESMAGIGPGGTHIERATEYSPIERFTKLIEQSLYDAMESVSVAAAIF